MATGRTGYTPPTNASSMLGPSQMADIYAWFDARVDLSVANAAALPSSGNWTGRQAITQDYGLLYWWNGTGWKAVSPSNVRFKGSIVTATALTANTNIAYSTIVEDTAVGWNSTSNSYTIPVAGTYLVLAQVKQSTSVSVGIAVRKNGTNVAYSGSAPATNTGGIQIAHYEVCAAGDTISAIVGANITTASDAPAHNNFLEIVRLA